MYFKTCNHCNGYIEVGEKCDCRHKSEAAGMGQPPTKQQLAEYLGITVRSVGDRLRAHGGFTMEGDAVVRNKKERNDTNETD